MAMKQAYKLGEMNYNINRQEEKLKQLEEKLKLFNLNAAEVFVTQSQLDRLRQDVECKLGDMKKQVESANTVPEDVHVKIQNMMKFFENQAGVATNNRKILEQMVDFFANLCDEMRLK